MSDERATVDRIIKNGYVVTMDSGRTVISDGAIAITGRDIVAVGPTSEVLSTFTAAETIDAGGALVLPGLVDAHRHPIFLLYSWREDGQWPQVVTNGGPFGHGGDIDALIRYCSRPFGGALTPEEAYMSALAEFVGLIRSGVTCFSDGATGQPDSVAQAAVDAGMRGIVTRHSTDLTANERHLERIADVDEVLRQSAETVERWHGAADGRIRAWHFLAFPVGSSDELCRGIRELADTQHVGIGTHVATVPHEAAASMHHWNLRPLTRLRELGLFGEDLLTVHNGFSSNEELAWMVEDNVKAVHCPGTSARLHHGIISKGRIVDMVGAGMSVGLGTDSCTAGNMLFQLASATSFHKDVSLNPATLDAPVTLEMATITGARACIWDDEIGSLEPGKRADLILVDRSALHWQPNTEPVRTFVNDCQPNDIRTVIIDGQIVMRDGAITVLDEEKLIHDLRQTSDSFLCRISEA